MCMRGAQHGPAKCVQDWLYDEGEDETKSVYTQKLQDLLRLGSPIEQREKEDKARPAAAEALVATAKHYLAIAGGTEAKYAHISQEDKDKVRLPTDIYLGRGPLT